MAKICQLISLSVYLEPVLPKFETGSYFLKSMQEIMYAWANKISQHSESSLET